MSVFEIPSAKWSLYIHREFVLIHFIYSTFTSTFIPSRARHNSKGDIEKSDIIKVIVLVLMGIIIFITIAVVMIFVLFSACFYFFFIVIIQ